MLENGVEQQVQFFRQEDVPKPYEYFFSNEQRLIPTGVQIESSRYTLQYHAPHKTRRCPHRGNGRHCCISHPLRLARRFASHGGLCIAERSMVRLIEQYAIGYVPQELCVFVEFGISKHKKLLKPRVTKDSDRLDNNFV